MKWRTVSGIDRTLLAYALSVGGAAEVTYLAAHWPAISLWDIVASIALTSMMVVQVFVVCRIVIVSLIPWMHKNLTEHGEVTTDG